MDAPRFVSKNPTSCRRTAAKYFFRSRKVCLSAVRAQQNPSVDGQKGNAQNKLCFNNIRSIDSFTNSYFCQILYQILFQPCPRLKQGPREQKEREPFQFQPLKILIQMGVHRWRTKIKIKWTSTMTLVWFCTIHGCSNDLVPRKQQLIYIQLQFLAIYQEKVTKDIMNDYIVVSVSYTCTLCHRLYLVSWCCQTVFL